MIQVNLIFCVKLFFDETYVNIKELFCLMSLVIFVLEISEVQQTGE